MPRSALTCSEDKVHDHSTHLSTLKVLPRAAPSLVEDFSDDHGGGGGLGDGQTPSNVAGWTGQ